MTGLEKWKEDRAREVEKANVSIAGNEIWHRVDRCKYCRYHVGKDCIRENGCWEGIREYLEGEIGGKKDG